MPAWVDQGVEEYTRRMPREISVEWLDIPPAKRGSATPEKYRVQEAEELRELQSTPTRITHVFHPVHKMQGGAEPSLT